MAFGATKQAVELDKSPESKFFDAIEGSSFGMAGGNVAPVDDMGIPKSYFDAGAMFPSTQFHADANGGALSPQNDVLAALSQFPTSSMGGVGEGRTFSGIQIATIIGILIAGGSGAYLLFGDYGSSSVEPPAPTAALASPSAEVAPPAVASDPLAQPPSGDPLAAPSVDASAPTQVSTLAAEGGAEPVTDAVSTSVPMGAEEGMATADAASAVAAAAGPEASPPTDVAEGAEAQPLVIGEIGPGTTEKVMDALSRMEAWRNGQNTIDNPTLRQYFSHKKAWVQMTALWVSIERAALTEEEVVAAAGQMRAQFNHGQMRRFMRRVMFANPETYLKMREVLQL